jgi:hypothetical protein
LRKLWEDTERKWDLWVTIEQLSLENLPEWNYEEKAMVNTYVPSLEKKTQI